jgi:hypothetical protein
MDSPTQASPRRAAEALEKAGDLRTYEAGLRANPNIRVIVNQNDFLLTDEDLAWLHATFAPKQLTVFAQGGHLENLFNPTVQKTILGALRKLPAHQHVLRGHSASAMSLAKRQKIFLGWCCKRRLRCANWSG